MERDPEHDAGSERAAADRRWSDKVESRQPVVLDARQLDQMVAALGHCVSAVYAVIEAIQADGDGRFHRDRFAEVYRSIGEASELLETLTTDLVK